MIPIKALMLLPLLATVDYKPGTQMWIWEHQNHDHIKPTADAPEPAPQQPEERPQEDPFAYNEPMPTFMWPGPFVYIQPQEFYYAPYPPPRYYHPYGGGQIYFYNGHHRHRRY